MSDRRGTVGPARAAMALGAGLGAGLGLALALLDGVLAGVRGAGPQGALVAAGAAVALLVPLAVAVAALAFALLGHALGPPSLPARAAVLWSAARGEPAAGRLVGGLVALAVFLGLHRAATGLVDEVVRSTTFRSLAAVLVALGAWSVAALVGGTVARGRLARRPRPRTLLVAAALGLALLAALPWFVARPFAEALGLEFFLAPVAASLGAALGAWVTARGRARALLLVAVTGVVLGGALLASPDARATIAWGTVSARRVLPLLPAFAGGGAGAVRPEPRPPLFAPSAPASLVRRRPVVLVSLDAVGADHLHLHGFARPTAPTLEAWAHGAVTFDAAVPPGPVTRLSVPSFFVGRNASQVAMTRRTGVTNTERLADTTLAERLQAAGYRTVAVPGGRYFVGFRGLTQGFDEVDRAAADQTRRLETRGAIVTARALVALEAARQRAQPTFLWVHYDDAHAPHSAIPGAPAWGGREIDRYDQEIWWIDRQLATLLPAIERALGDRDPLVIVTADHGERFGPGGRAVDRAQALVPGTLWVPLVVRLRGLPAHRVHGAVSLLDLGPTILDLVGLSPRARFEGRSLVPELLGRRDDRARVVFAELDQAGPRVLDAVAARRGGELLLVDRRVGARRAYDLARDRAGERPGARISPDLDRLVGAHVARLEADRARSHRGGLGDGAGLR